MAKKQPRVGECYIEQRTRSLATIYLTRRDDLLVAPAEPDDGVDLQVTIRTRKERVPRRFGVLLKGVVSDLTVEQANAMLKANLEALSVREFTYPVCLFLFCMENDAGIYTWVAEPLVTQDGSPVLNHRNEADCRELDTPAINAIAASVSAWYDAFAANVLEGSPRRRRPGGLEVLHGIIDAEADYFRAHGKPPQALKLPVLQAYELAKLGREHLGDLAGSIVKDGVRVLERNGLLGMKVKLVPDQDTFSLE